MVIGLLQIDDNMPVDAAIRAGVLAPGKNAADSPRLHLPSPSYQFVGAPFRVAARILETPPSVTVRVKPETLDALQNADSRKIALRFGDFGSGACSTGTFSSYNPAL